MAAPWRRSTPPKGWDEIEQVVLALDAESREVLAESHLGKRKVETEWPVYQLNNQRTRYIWDMFSRYKRIDKRLYDWCVKHRLVDALLVAKWKRPGYDRLCSTFVINPKNFNYGTTSICRVPKQNLPADGKPIVSNATGCLGCASGPGGFHNIFGNKYGQNLADIQMCRERGKLQEAGLWSEAKAAEEWAARGTGGAKGKRGKRNRLELLALEPNGEVWATDDEEKAMLRAKRGIDSAAEAEAASMAHAAAATAVPAEAPAAAAAAEATSGAPHMPAPHPMAHMMPHPMAHMMPHPMAHMMPHPMAPHPMAPHPMAPHPMVPQYMAPHHGNGVPFSGQQGARAAAPPQVYSMGAYTAILNHSSEGRAAAAAAADTAEAAGKRERGEGAAEADEDSSGGAAAAEPGQATAEDSAPGGGEGAAEAKRSKVAAAEAE